MDITRDLYPTDERSPYLTLALTSRDVASHNLLTTLSPAQRTRIGEALTTAGAAIVEVLRAAMTDTAPAGQQTDFGCGT